VTNKCPGLERTCDRYANPRTYSHTKRFTNIRSCVRE
jgi:hypothetical protein